VVAWRDGHLVEERVRLENSSLASQAVGPVLNEMEMSYAGQELCRCGAEAADAAAVGAAAGGGDR
jgi:hypothetical protein